MSNTIFFSWVMAKNNVTYGPTFISQYSPYARAKYTYFYMYGVCLVVFHRAQVFFSLYYTRICFYPLSLVFDSIVTR